MNDQSNLNSSANGSARLGDLSLAATEAAEIRGGLTKPAEIAPSLRPPPPKLPPDPPPPTFK